ncbi:transcription factor E2F7 isoform X3 [Sphaerodactylus townsendi]|uniref:transcription factor E2F7 isoform X3 n=1 Tax=Sphaerodactylus townsendi TaxID=933632 RepID=UPI00202648ED|nr:transcription factor E2F7 isoform X3 [Sphaerodactylus townsendi]
MDVNYLTLKDLISPIHTKMNFADEDGENAQKENIFDRPRMTPKTPMKNEPIDLSKQKSCTPERNPITPVKLSDRPLTDPWTPTANLKMLISAASPDMRDREKKKELFRPIENSEFGDAFLDSSQCDAVDDGTADDYDKHRPSRKQKSLGLLCQKFLARYPSYPLSAEKTTISLDEVASSLGVERRRIYDIVNVLESLHLVSRVAKNQYCWHGRHNLSQTLKNLQEIGELQKYEELMAYFQHKEVDLECRSGEHKRETFIDFQDRQLLDFSETDCPSASANSRKDKSLRIMSKKFVMLFLVSKTKIVTLDIAAKILIEESQDTADHSKFKTKVRRLYDIANVLTSLELIKKVHVTEERGRKPAFKWIGPVEFSDDCEDCCSKMINLASICCQKMDNDESKAIATERTKNLGIISPFSVLPVPGDSDYLSAAFPHLSTSTCSDKPNLSPPNGMNDQVLPLSGLSASRTETGKSSVLSNQSLVYLPSPSLYMLCGSLHESLSSMEDKGIIGFQGLTSETAESPLDCRKRSFPKCASPTAASAEEEPTVKRQSMEENDQPISLVLSKKTIKPMDPEASPDHNCNSIDQLRAFQIESGIPIIAEISEKETAKRLETQEQEKPYRCKVLKENMSENEQVSQENSKQSFLPQYLYVQPTSGLNNFNFLFPANQSPDPVSLPPSRLPSLSVPCVVVPSPALPSFPLICSPAVTNPLSPAPAGSFPNVSCMNFSMPGLTSTTPVFIGTPAVIAPNSSQLSTFDPHQQIHPAVRLSTMLGSACSSVKADSPTCLGHPLTLLKLQQPSSAPLTPKSIRPTHQETFFKTPGSLEDPVVWRKNEGNQSRTASSVQRRLEISSSSSG